MRVEGSPNSKANRPAPITSWQMNEESPHGDTLGFISPKLQPTKNHQWNAIKAKLEGNKSVREKTRVGFNNPDLNISGNKIQNQYGKDRRSKERNLESLDF